MSETEAVQTDQETNFPDIENSMRNIVGSNSNNQMGGRQGVPGSAENLSRSSSEEESAGETFKGDHHS